MAELKMRDRDKGEYYTPEVVSRFFYEKCNEIYPDFADKFAVWDNCCGTGNLTRYWDFKELYQSTLREEDIAGLRLEGINEGSVKFTYDFLSQDTEILLNPQLMMLGDVDMPSSLWEALNTDGKDVIVYVNPPYVTSSSMVRGNIKRMGGGNKRVQTKFDEVFRGWDSALLSAGTVVQWLFKLYLMSKVCVCNLHLAVIMPMSNYTGITNIGCSKFVKENFTYRGGYVFTGALFESVGNFPLGLYYFDVKESSKGDYGWQKVLELDDSGRFEEAGRVYINPERMKYRAFNFDRRELSKVYGLYTLKGYTYEEGIVDGLVSDELMGWSRVNRYYLISEGWVNINLYSVPEQSMDCAPVLRSNVEEVLCLLALAVIFRNIYYLFKNGVAICSEFSFSEVEKNTLMWFGLVCYHNRAQALRYGDTVIKNEFNLYTSEQLRVALQELSQSEGLELNVDFSTAGQRFGSDFNAKVLSGELEVLDEIKPLVGYVNGDFLKEYLRGLEKIGEGGTKVFAWDCSLWYNKKQLESAGHRDVLKNFVNQYNKYREILRKLFFNSKLFEEGSVKLELNDGWSEKLGIDWK